MSELQGLKTYRINGVTVVTFEDRGDLAQRAFFGNAAEHFGQIVADHRCSTLVLDMTAITALPSAMLGVLVGLHNRGIQVRLFNITDDVRFTLQTANLDQVFEVREGDLSSILEDAKEE